MGAINHQEIILSQVDEICKTENPEPKILWVVSSNIKLLDIAMNELAYKLIKKYPLKVVNNGRFIFKILDKYKNRFSIEAKYIDPDNLQNTEGYSMINRQALQHFVKEVDMNDVYPLEIKDRKLQSVFYSRNPHAILEGIDHGN
jgi:hypothetical protein